MKFVFPFETLLNYRKRLEQAAQGDFAQAQREADECLQLISDMYSDIDRTRATISQLEVNGGSMASQAVAMEEFIELQKIKIERQRHVARELLQVVEEKKQILIEAAREHKVLERLRERRYKEHKKKIKKKELKETDENNTMRFGRGGW